ncbi:hypothetical protein B0H14DRAFT_3575436 [Mycena olivaceomarginata]|nr:hypothetical protein B0H14DRAFT_3575436 [Mycena olivaceomarginata]
MHRTFGIPEILDLIFATSRICEIWDSPLPRFRSLVHPQTPRFSTLHDLFFGNTTLEFAIEFLDQLSNCCLVTFHVGTTVSATTSATRQLYAALASHFNHSTLQTLHIGFPESHSVMETTPPALSNYLIDGPILATLFCFGNLTEITLEPPVGFDIDDETVADMARAWPKLKSRCLIASSDLHHPSSMLLNGLCVFANHCYELTYLTIAFDASTVPPFDDSSVTAVSQSSLTSLDVGASPMIHPSLVAQFLSRLFPNLAIIRTLNEWCRDDEENISENPVEHAQYTRWEQVQIALSRNSKDASK